MTTPKLIWNRGCVDDHDYDGASTTCDSCATIGGAILVGEVVFCTDCSCHPHQDGNAQDACPVLLLCEDDQAGLSEAYMTADSACHYASLRANQVNCFDQHWACPGCAYPHRGDAPTEGGFCDPCLAAVGDAIENLCWSCRLVMHDVLLGDD